jgi:MFS family permease
MAQTRTPRTIHRYYLYQVTLSLGLYVPVSVLYLRDSGFSLAFVGLAGAVFSFSLLLAEVPTGYLADRLGRRRTLVLGSVCRVVGVGGYAVANTAVAFLLLKVFLGVGWALRSGTTDAYLYELLARTGEEDRFTTVNGRGRAALLGTSAVTAVFGGLAYELSSVLPFLANAALGAAGIPLLVSLPATSGSEEASEHHERFTVREALQSLRQQARRPSIRWVVLYSILVLIAFDVTRSFEQPAFRAIGFGAAQLGVLYALFKLASAAAGAAAGPLRDRLGTRRALGVLAPGVGLLYGALIFVPELLLAVGVCYRSVRSILLPIRNQYLNDRLPDAGRATVLSGVSMLLSLLGGIARIGVGSVADAVGPLQVIALSGAVAASLAVTIWFVTRPVRGGSVDVHSDQAVSTN